MPTTPGDLDPAVAAAVRASFARQGLMATLGAHLVQVAPGHVVITAELTPALTQQHGHFHGGVVGAIGDSAGGYAALTLMPVGSEVVTVEYKINFLRAAAGPKYACVTLARTPSATLMSKNENPSCCNPFGSSVCGKPRSIAAAMNAS